MANGKINTFDYSKFRPFVKACLSASPRGAQARLAKAIGCQATYLIKVLKEDAHFTEDQAYKAAVFLGLSDRETDYFLDLVRLDRVADLNTKIYLQGVIGKKLKASQDIKNRVKGVPLDSSLRSQLRYFSSIKPSIVHLGTSCSHLQTPGEISRKFRIDPDEVRQILLFLQEEGLVKASDDGKYRHSGKMIHLPKDSPLHPNFQKLRREMALRRFDEKQSDLDLHFSMAISTSKSHLNKLRKELLRLIKEMNIDLEKSSSEEIALIVVDFFPVT